jgi:hypothetical protein
VKIRSDPGPLKESHLSGHVIRFAMGGAVTAATGLVAEEFGPVVGGLFLALPAILPAGIALLVRLQNRKAGPGARGDRARRAVVIEATGASAGALGLVAFALVGWACFGHWPAWLTLAAATAAWSAVAALAWFVRKARRNEMVRAKL